VLKVCYVFQDKYPWDVRVEKIMDSLVNNGFECHILSRNRERMPKTEKINNNLTIHRLPALPYNWMTSVMNIPAFFSPVWIGEMVMLIKKIKADILIVRDLPLAPAALLSARITKCPIIMDMAENYPAMIQDTWKYRGPGPFDYIIRNPCFLRIMEKYVVPRMDGVFVVSDYSKKRVSKLGLDPSHIWIVSNTPRIDNIDTNNEIYCRELAKIKAKTSLMILYVGGLEESRGLDIVIRALPIVHKQIPSATFIVVGEGSAKDKLIKLSSYLRIQDRVVFTGWVDNRHVSSIIKSSDVCIVPHYVTEHTDTTIPNKIFDYMLQRKPVVVTNSMSLSDIIKSSDCGRIYVHDDPIDLAIKISELDKAEARERYGNNGYDAILQRYNWAIEEKNLLLAFNELKKNSMSPLY